MFGPSLEKYFFYNKKSKLGVTFGATWIKNKFFMEKEVAFVDVVTKNMCQREQKRSRSLAPSAYIYTKATLIVTVATPSPMFILQMYSDISTPAPAHQLRLRRVCARITIPHCIK